MAGEGGYMFTTEKNGKLESLKLFIDNKDVSSLRIVDVKIMIGESVIDTGGIASVRTDDAYRYKGYARQVLNESIRIMTDRGFDISMLFGIYDFYHKFGYATVFPEHLLTVPVQYAKEARGIYAVSAYEPQYRDELIGLYNNHQIHYTGSAIRGGNWVGFRGAMEGGGGVRYGADRDWRFVDTKGVVIKDGGKLTGYAFYEVSNRGVYVTEVLALNSSGYSSLLRHIIEVASGHGDNEAYFYMPADHPFARFCRQYGFDATVLYPHEAEGMVRIINIVPLFTKLLPTFNTRLKSSGYKGEKAISFDTDIGAVTLFIKDENVTMAPGCAEGALTIRTGQDKLAALIMGYVSADDFVFNNKNAGIGDNDGNGSGGSEGFGGDGGGSSSAGAGNKQGGGAHDNNDIASDCAAMTLLRVLFPAGDGYMWIPDRF